MADTVKLIFRNRRAKQINVNSLRPDGSHHYINQNYALVAVQAHFDKCPDGYIEVAGQPCFTFSQADLAIHRFFNRPSP